MFVCVNGTAPPGVYTYLHTLSLRDALPIFRRLEGRVGRALPRSFGTDRTATVVIDVQGQGFAIPDLDEDESYRLDAGPRSEEHTSELQSLMRTSYAVFCLKKKRE